MKYAVHIFAVVRVKIPDVEAESQAEAIRKAEESTDLYGTLNWPIGRMCHVDARGVSEVEYAEENLYYLVDEEGDEKYANSRHYKADGVTPEFEQQIPAESA